MPETLDRIYYDERAPQTEHRGLAAEMYAEDFLGQADGPILNVAAGHTNLRADLYDAGIVQEVVSLDPIYATNSLYRDRPDRMAGTAQVIDAPDDTFAVTLCQFGLQHMGSDVDVAVREMIRVTKTADSTTDPKQGAILLNPVFKPKALTQAIFDEGLQDVCGIQDPPSHVRNGDAKPTLLIKKTDLLTEDKVNALVRTLAETGAMTRSRKVVGEKISRMFRGSSRR